MSATAIGMGRLLIWEDFAVGLNTSLRGAVGRWDSDARWRDHADDYEELDWRSEVWGLVRVHRRAAVYAAVPWLVSWRASGALERSGAGISDIRFGARFEALEIGEYVEFPGLAFLLTVSAPTGRAMHETQDVLGADVTTRGAWTIGVGMSLEKTHLPWFVRLDVGGVFALPMERDDLGKTQQLGHSLVLGVAGGAEIVSHVVLSLVARLTWESSLSIGGVTVDNSERTDAGLGLAVSWRVQPHWTLQLGLDTGLFANDLGDNQSGGVTGSFGVRYGSF